MSESDIATRPHIGTDESGKGDYFGALVVAAAYADEVALVRLPQAGIRDAKRISTSRLWEQERAVKQICPAVDVVVILPPRYNELHRKMRNLNSLLAWGHARAIENVLGKVACDLAVTDQFGDEHYLEQSLMERGRRVELVQRVRAEDDPVVAAASVLARAAFIRSLERLSQVVGAPLPRGAVHVLPTARQIFEKGGEELLGQVAKIHFKTTKAVKASGG